MNGPRLRRIVAWTGTFLLLAYLATTTNLREAWGVVRGADSLHFLAGLLLGVPLMWALDSWSAHRWLRILGYDVRLSEFAPVRGATYLLGIVNYSLTVAMLTAVVARRTRRGLWASGGAFLLLGLVDLGALSLAVLAGLLAFPSPFPPVPTALLAAVGVAGLLAAPSMAVLARAMRRFRTGLPGRLAGWTVWAAFREVPFPALAGMLPLRLLLILAQVGMNLAFLRAFGFDVGAREVLVFMPLLGLIGVLPISVAGLGSTQIVARGFFAPYAPAGVSALAAVDAVSTASILGVMVARVLLGLACLPFALRTGAKERQPA